MALLLAGLAATACGTDPAAETKAATTDEAPPGQPRPDMPAPPPPAPALNHYADRCLGGELPAEGEELRTLTANCFDNLLETLRAAIGTGELPQAVVGQRLDDTEVAVRHLTIGVADDDLPARVQTAALSLVELAAAIGEALPGSPAQAAAGIAAEEEARAAAAGIDPQAPLTEQTPALAAFLRTADGQVRPLVRYLSGPHERAPGSPAATPGPSPGAAGVGAGDDGEPPGGM